MTAKKLTERLQEVLDMQKVVMSEQYGRPDCKSCSLAEVIQELLDKEQPSGN